MLEPRPILLRHDHPSWRSSAFGRDRRIAQRFNSCPQLFPALPLLRWQVGGPRRTDTFQGAVHAPATKGWDNKLRVGCGDLRECGQIGSEKVEGLFAVRLSLCDGYGGRPLAVGAVHGGARGVEEGKPRIVRAGGKSGDSINDLLKALGWPAQRRQARCVERIQRRSSFGLIRKAS